VESGEEITVSEDHIFYGAKGREIPAWVRANDLKNNDYLCVPRCENVDLYESDVVWKKYAK
jgi:intein/homing endonuclease